MNQADRDRLFELMIYYDDMDSWIKDETSELPNKDLNKIKIIKDNILALMVQYRKVEGTEAMKTLFEESKKYKFAIMPKEEETEVTGTMENIMLKNAVKKVVATQTQCSYCDRCDYKNCEWFALKNFLKEEKQKYKKNQCPYKEDLFENLEDL